MNMEAQSVLGSSTEQPSSWSLDQISEQTFDFNLPVVDDGSTHLRAIPSNLDCREHENCASDNAVLPELPDTTANYPNENPTQSANVMSSEKWQLWRPQIENLYKEQDLTLAEIKKIMSDEYGFNASIQMYKRRITHWDLQKNRKLEDSLILAELGNKVSRQGKILPTHDKDGHVIDWNRVRRAAGRKGLKVYWNVPDTSGLLVDQSKRTRKKINPDATTAVTNRTATMCHRSEVTKILGVALPASLSLTSDESNIAAAMLAFFDCISYYNISSSGSEQNHSADLSLYYKYEIATAGSTSLQGQAHDRCDEALEYLQTGQISEATNLFKRCGELLQSSMDFGCEQQSAILLTALLLSPGWKNFRPYQKAMTDFVNKLVCSKYPTNDPLVRIVHAIHQFSPELVNMSEFVLKQCFKPKVVLLLHQQNKLNEQVKLVQERASSMIKLIESLQNAINSQPDLIIEFPGTFYLLSEINRWFDQYYELTSKSQYSERGLWVDDKVNELQQMYQNLSLTPVIGSAIFDGLEEAESLRAKQNKWLHDQRTR